MAKIDQSIISNTSKITSGRDGRQAGGSVIKNNNENSQIGEI
jgi:hypothetical protein